MDGRIHGPRKSRDRSLELVSSTVESSATTIRRAANRRTSYCCCCCCTITRVPSCISPHGARTTSPHITSHLTPAHCQHTLTLTRHSLSPVIHIAPVNTPVLFPALAVAPRPLSPPAAPLSQQPRTPCPSCAFCHPRVADRPPRWSSSAWRCCAVHSPSCLRWQHSASCYSTRASRTTTTRRSTGSATHRAHHIDHCEAF